MKEELNYSGFTLVEILVVITIISLLAITAIVSFSQIGKQSRDTRRKTDIEQVRTALEIYRNSNIYSSYPSDINSLVTNSYLVSLPLDPKTNQSYLTYSALPAGCDESNIVCNSYIISGNLETGDVYQTDPYGGSTITSTSAPQPSNTPPDARPSSNPSLTQTPTPTSGSRIISPTPTSGIEPSPPLDSEIF